MGKRTAVVGEEHSVRTGTGKIRTRSSFGRRRSGVTTSTGDTVNTGGCSVGRGTSRVCDTPHPTPLPFSDSFLLCSATSTPPSRTSGKRGMMSVRTVPVSGGKLYKSCCNCSFLTTGTHLRDLSLSGPKLRVEIMSDRHSSHFTQKLSVWETKE